MREMPAGTGTELSFGQHSVAPHSVAPQKSKKYRDLENAPLTLMSDPRVVRGSTSALARKVTASKEAESSSSSGSTKMLGTGAGSGGVAVYLDQLPRPSYVYEVQGHVGPDLDMTPYLAVKDETLSVRKKEVESQTNEFKERPPSPEYVPRKTGIDVTTQITQDDVSYLFDFDREVEPILNVIVYKTLEQALFEVESEEELLALDVAAKQFHSDRNAELEWRRQRELEDIAEKRAQGDLVAARVAEKKEERRVKSIIGAVQAMNQIIPGVFDAAVERLYQEKVWRRPEVASVEDLVVAKTNHSMKLKLKAYTAAQTLIDEMVVAASELYDSAPSWYDPPLPPVAEFTLLLRPDAAAAEGEEGAEAAPPKPKAIGPVRIYDRHSVLDVMSMLRKAAEEKGLPFPDLPLPTLHAYFSNVIGRPIAIDGAIMNFDPLVPANMTLTV